MAFLRADDDDDDFVLASGKSKLNSLFAAPENDGNESLTGKPSKSQQAQQAQRRPDDGTQQKAAPSEVFNACAVTAFRFVTAENRYQPAGQCGMALVGNLPNRDFKLVLYVSKQQQLGYAIVNGTFQLNISPNNYAAFYDSTKTLWMVMFDSAKSLAEFCKHLLLCRAACTNFATLTTQETSAASSDAEKENAATVDVDDQIEVRYTAWQVETSAVQAAALIKAVVDDNTASVKGLRFRVGQQKMVRGLEEGVLGMRRERGTKRLVLVPATSTAGMLASGPLRLPANSALLILVELARVRDDAAQSDDRGRSQSIVPLPAIPGASSPSQPQNPPSPVSVANELDDEVPSNKAKLLNRMAKMGQAVLPTQQRADDPAAPANATPQHANPQAHTPPQPQPQLQVPVHAPVQAAPTVPLQMHVDPSISMQHAMNQSLMGATVQNNQMNATAPQTLMLGQQYAALNQPMYNMSTQPPSAAVSNALVPLNSAYAANQNAFLSYGASAALGAQSMYAQAAYGAPQQMQPMPPAQPVQPQLPQTGDMQSFVMMNETRQNVTELRLQVGKLADKLDKVYDKVAESGSGGSVANALALPSNVMMETQAVMSSIQRIVAENERLKRESFERAEKIDALNERVNELVAKNSVTSERGSAMLESAGERLKAEVHQQASRVLELENVRLKLMSELAEKTGALTDSLRELEDMRRREAEARSRLNAVLAADEARRDESAALRTQLADSNREGDDLRARLRDERAARKQFESRATELDESLAELREAHASLDKQLAERKRRNAADRQRFEELLATERAAHDAELTAAREQVRTSASVLDAAEIGRADAARAQLEADLRARFDKQLTTERSRLQRIASEEREERERTAKQAAEMTDRVASLRVELTKRESELEKANETLAELRIANERLDRTAQRLAARTNDATERELAQTQAELQTALERLEDARRERDTLARRCRELETAKPVTVVATTAATGDSSGEVKRIMNSVFQSLRKQLDAASMYSGKDVLAMLLSTIKSTTLSLLTTSNAPAALDSPKPAPPPRPSPATPVHEPARQPAEQPLQLPVPPDSTESDSAQQSNADVHPEVNAESNGNAQDDEESQSVEHNVATPEHSAPLAEPDLVAPTPSNLDQPEPQDVTNSRPEPLSSRTDAPVGLDVLPLAAQSAGTTESPEHDSQPPSRGEHSDEHRSPDGDSSHELLQSHEAVQAQIAPLANSSLTGPDLLPDERLPSEPEADAVASNAVPEAQHPTTDSKPDIMMTHSDDEHEAADSNAQTNNDNQPDAHNESAVSQEPADDSSAASPADDAEKSPGETPVTGNTSLVPPVVASSATTSRSKLFDDDDDDDEDEENDVLSLFASAKPNAAAPRSEAQADVQAEARPSAANTQTVGDHSDTKDAESVKSTTDSVARDAPVASEEATQKDGETAAKAKSATSSHSSLTSGVRGNPPPLFGDDDDDEEDLDWLKGSK